MAPTSSTLPQRPTGMDSRNCLFRTGSFISTVFIGVAKGPGERPLTVMPSLASSSARARVKPKSAVLAEE
ncbi:hypothetical protein D3C83_172060 [compost metagenome]